MILYIYIVVHPILQVPFPLVKLKLYPSNTNSPLPLPQPLATTILFVSMSLTSLGTSYEGNHIVFVFL